MVPNEDEELKVNDSQPSGCNGESP